MLYQRFLIEDDSYIIQSLFVNLNSLKWIYGLCRCWLVNNFYKCCVAIFQQIIYEGMVSLFFVSCFGYVLLSFYEHIRLCTLLGSRPCRLGLVSVFSVLFQESSTWNVTWVRLWLCDSVLLTWCCGPMKKSIHCDLEYPLMYIFMRAIVIFFRFYWGATELVGKISETLIYKIVVFI